MKQATILTGGVGGAKLVLGLVSARPDLDVTAIVNTGDDFTHLGLHVSPDIDTLLYTLSGKSNEQLGWGRKDETWSFMSAVRSLSGPDWFNLGDGDLALHVLRSARLAEGNSLSEIIRDFAVQWAISAKILPMSDDPVRTMVRTDQGVLGFQNYFVEHKCQPAVSGIEFEGASKARTAPGVQDAILDADVVMIAPSNPYLSVDPILAVPGIAGALRETRAPVVAVSPIVGGTAVKGPTAKIMRELGIAPDNSSIAEHYAGLLDGLVFDEQDEPPRSDIARYATDTLMKTLEDRQRVALAALDLATGLSAG